MARKLGIPAALMALATIAAAQTAGAQVATILKPIQIGAALGAAIPLDGLSTSFNTGFNFTGTIGINPAGLPVGFRIDAAYNQFGSKGATISSAKIAGVSGNVLLRMAGAEMAPYAIGGLGYYRVSHSVTGGVASNHFGFNAGAGLDIPLSGLKAFIEARYNRITENGGSTSFVPVTVGVMF